MMDASELCCHIDLEQNYIPPPSFALPFTKEQFSTNTDVLLSSTALLVFGT